MTNSSGEMMDSGLINDNKDKLYFFTDYYSDHGDTYVCIGINYKQFSDIINISKECIRLYEDSSYEVQVKGVDLV